MNACSFKFTLTTLLGNMIEWYDFALYGYFATVIAKLFFPTQNESLSLLLTFDAFATGFIARPIGSIIFGYIGDRHGRRMSLLLSIFLIMLPTSVVGLLPSYQSIGYFAPVLLTLCRIVQGIAVSGELTTSGIFLIESVPSKNKSFYGSLIMASTYMGLLIGAIICVATSTVFDTAQILAFGWRIPFFISFFLGLLAILLRLQCQESPVFQAMQHKKELLATPIREVTLYGTIFEGVVASFYLGSRKRTELTFVSASAAKQSSVLHFKATGLLPLRVAKTKFVRRSAATKQSSGFNVLR